VREKLLLVDGHSAIYSTDWLKDIHESHQESGRRALVKELTEFQNMSDLKVVIVFDGKGALRGKEGGTEKDPLVIFSRTNETADRVIERIAAQQASKNDVEVSSNDRMVLDSCSASGAHVYSITGLWDKLDKILSCQRKKFRS